MTDIIKYLLDKLGIFFWPILLVTAITVLILNYTKIIEFFKLFETNTGKAQAFAILVVIFAGYFLIFSSFCWCKEKIDGKNLENKVKLEKFTEIFLINELKPYGSNAENKLVEVSKYSKHKHLLIFLFRQNLKQFTPQILEETFRKNQMNAKNDIEKQINFQFLTYSGNVEVLQDLCNYKLLILKDDTYIVDNSIWEKLKKLKDQGNF